MRQVLVSIAVGFAFLFCGNAGCNTQSQEGRTVDGLTQVTLVLNWFPEAEHGGYYAALVHGYYEQAGLKVTIVPGGPSAASIQQVDRGRAMFGVENADKLLQGRAQGATVVAVMAPIQISPRCILVHRNSGIGRLRELKDVTLAVNPGAAWAKFLQRKLPLKNVKLVPYSGLALFLKNDDYAVQGYTFSEPLTAREQGADPVPLLVSDLGFNPYTSLLIARAEEIEKRPGIVRKMVAASIRGWKTYLADPGRTNAHIHALNDRMSLKALQFGADAMKPLCVTKEVGLEHFGTMTAERWQTLAKQLVEVGALDAGRADAAGAFTVQFVR